MFFHVFGYAWLAIAGIVIVMGMLGVGINIGFPAVQRLLSPLNLPKLVAAIIAVAPGIVLLIIADMLEHKIKSKRMF